MLYSLLYLGYRFVVNTVVCCSVLFSHLLLWTNTVFLLCVSLALYEWQNTQRFINGVRYLHYFCTVLVNWVT